MSEVVKGYQGSWKIYFSGYFKEQIDKHLVVDGLAIN